MGDEDGDSAETATFDKDDHVSLEIGHAASAADRKAIASLVTRYYAAISTGDATTGCSLLFRVFAETIAETTNRREQTCPEVLAEVTSPLRSRLAAESHNLHVVAVRVKGVRGWAIIRFGPKSVRRLIVFREGGSWKVGTVIDSGLV